MAGQHRRRPSTSPALMRADDRELPSPPQAANDIETVLPVREVIEMDLSAEPRRNPATRQSCVQAALRAEILCRGMRMSQSEFTRRHGPPSAIVRNWARLEARPNGIKG
ncbi:MULTISPECIES: hypothetical protein [unclassified Inquilinus]|uniref:hypothetical protein n=1 Tax=unclassified Inquilinus TaxID=2645927 RepID=UPI003F93349D